MRGLRHRYHAGGLPQLQHFPQLQAHVEHVSHDAIQLICTVLQEPEANAIQTVNLLHLSLLQVVPHLKCCKGQGCGVREGCKMKFSEQKWVRDGWELSSLGKKSRRLLKMRGVAAGETREWWVTDYICRRTVSAYSSTVNLLQPGHLVSLEIVVRLSNTTFFPFSNLSSQLLSVSWSKQSLLFLMKSHCFRLDASAAKHWTFVRGTELPTQRFSHMMELELSVRVSLVSSDHFVIVNFIAGSLCTRGFYTHEEEPGCDLIPQVNGLYQIPSSPEITR